MICPFQFEVLNEHEVANLVQQIRDNVTFSRSKTVDPSGGVVSEVRTSESGSLPYNSKETRKLRQMAASIFNVPESHCEPQLALAKYGPGQEYRWHHDACCDDSESCVVFRSGLGNAGDRIGTLLMYLSDGCVRCGTAFRKQVFVPKKGFGVAWSTGGCPEWAEHAGEPVQSGEKLIATVWVRERPVDF